MTSYLDFRNCSAAKNATMILRYVDFEKLKIPLDRFTIKVDDNQTYEQQIILYQQVLNALKENGLAKKYESMDKDYQQLQLIHNERPIINLLEKHWWDYGYNKALIFRNSLIFFGVFLFINLLLFKHLIKVYLPANIEEYYNNLKNDSGHTNKVKIAIYTIPCILLYTAFIFWGLKLDVKDLKVKHWLSLTLIIVEYSVGIICLAYLANYVLSK
jgi:hypothetical protein